MKTHGKPGSGLQSYLMIPPWRFLSAEHAATAPRGASSSIPPPNIGITIPHKLVIARSKFSRGRKNRGQLFETVGVPLTPSTRWLTA